MYILFSFRLHIHRAKKRTFASTSQMLHTRSLRAARCPLCMGPSAWAKRRTAYRDTPMPIVRADAGYRYRATGCCKAHLVSGDDADAVVHWHLLISSSINRYKKHQDAGENTRTLNLPIRSLYRALLIALYM